MKMVMQYGDDKPRPLFPQGIELVSSDTILDSTTVELTFDPGGMYILFCAEFNATTGAFKGDRAILIKAPQDSLFGTIAVHRGNMYVSSESGVTITANNDSTITLARNSSKFGFRYALYKVL